MQSGYQITKRNTVREEPFGLVLSCRHSGMVRLPGRKTSKQCQTPRPCNPHLRRSANERWRGVYGRGWNRLWPGRLPRSGKRRGSGIASFQPRRGRETGTRNAAGRSGIQRSGGQIRYLEGRGGTVPILTQARCRQNTRAYHYQTCPPRCPQLIIIGSVPLAAPACQYSTCPSRCPRAVAM
jgi:hypothetical protein